VSGVGVGITMPSVTGVLIKVGSAVGVGIMMPSVTGVLIKVGSAVGVVSTVSSVLVGDVLEVLLSAKVEMRCNQGWAGVYTGSDSELTNKKLKHLHWLRYWIKCNT